MKFTLASAVNNEEVLKSCLLNSPGAVAAEAVVLRRGFRSAAAAYNEVIQQAKTDVVVFAHQDVYLPTDWVSCLTKAIDQLNHKDPDWAVAGVWGIRASGEEVGFVYCAGQGRCLGGEFSEPVGIQTLDELLLVVRKSSGVQFDENLPGYHMYGSDICLEAQRRGKKCYAISAFCIHNTNGYGMLPWQFWKCYLLMRRKWSSVLPVITPCTKISTWCWPMLRWNAAQAANLILKRPKIGKRVSDPAELYRELVATDKVRPVTAAI